MDVLASPGFRRALADAVADTSPRLPPRPACLLSAEGWRYRARDAPRQGFPDWGPREDGNWRWHHQQLALLDAYAGDSATQAGIIASWRPDDPVFSWGDHTTALRLKRLVRFFGVAFDELAPEFRIRLAGMIAEHARRLMGDVARHHHNHALDQVYALALARRHLPFLAIPLDDLRKRLDAETSHLLSRESVVTENSPGYQAWIPARIGECQRLLHGEADAAMLGRAQVFTDWMARPDGTWPQIGDTAPGKPADATCRPEGFRAFPHAGYAVYRRGGLHVAIKCGFLSHAHRHADDGSLLVAREDGDLLVEGGMFGYVKGWEREFARSPEAHNISYRAGARVIRSTTSRRYGRHHSRWGMVDVGPGARVQCRSFMFHDAVYTREFLAEGRTIHLVDRFDQAGNIHTRFHVPAERRISLAPGEVRIDDARIVHDLPEPRIVEGHHTIGYLRYGPAQTIEFTWPAERTEASFVLEA